MLFKITLTTKSLMKSDNCYVEAPDRDTADCFAEQQADSYGCTYFVQDSYRDEIPKESEIVHLNKSSLFVD